MTRFSKIPNTLILVYQNYSSLFVVFVMGGTFPGISFFHSPDTPYYKRKDIVNTFEKFKTPTNKPTNQREQNFSNIYI